MKRAPFLRRFLFAWTGITTAWRGEPNFRFQTVSAAAVLLLLSVTGAPPVWWALMALASGGVLGAELVNTALERLVDCVHPETHPSIKAVKDCAAGAVLTLSFFSLIVLAAYLWTLVY